MGVSAVSRFVQLFVLQVEEGVVSDGDAVPAGRGGRVGCRFVSVSVSGRSRRRRRGRSLGSLAHSLARSLTRLLTRVARYKSVAHFLVMEYVDEEDAAAVAKVEEMRREMGIVKEEEAKGGEERESKDEAPQ